MICRDDSVEQTLAGVETAQTLDQPPVTWDIEIFRFGSMDTVRTLHWAKENSGARGQSSHYPDTGDMGTFIRVLEAVTCIRRDQDSDHLWTVDTGTLIMTQFDPGPDRL